MPRELHGVMPPVPTPFDAAGGVAHAQLQSSLERLAATGLAGFVVLGSNGEAALLSDAEKREVVRTARRVIPSHKWLIAGTGHESTAATIAFTREAANLGADAALVLTPSFYKQKPESLRRHFEAVAGAAPIPILLYNVPKFTGINLPAAVAAELAAHPNIVGMKDSAGQVAQLAELRERTPADFRLFAGADPAFLAGLLHGCDGAILALANVAPVECVALYQAARAQRWDDARGLAQRLAPVGRLVVGTYGVPGLKAALDLLGAGGGEPRLPLLPLDAAGRTAIREVLQQAGLLPA